MEIITISMIKMRLDLLNDMVGITEKVSYKTIGGYTVYYANGKTGIEKITCDSGAVTTIIPLGTKRETFDRVCSFIDGLCVGLTLNN